MNQNIALIKNPVSRLNQKEDKEFTVFALNWLGENYSTPRTVDDMMQTLNRFVATGVDCIIIDGGDGTISHVMTAIYSCYPHDKLPSLIILPSGNTNLIAKDIGFGIRGINALKRIRTLAERQRLHFMVQHRHALKIEWSDPSRPPVLGMFQGAAAFTKAIQIAHNPTILKNFPHDGAVAITIITSLLKLFFSKTRDLWLNGNACSFFIDEKKSYQENCFLFLSTTLQSLSHGMWPFFNRYAGDDSLHYLNVKAHPPHLLAACFALLRGKTPEWLLNDPNYLSGTANKIKLSIKEDIILDGEQFDTGEDHCILLSTGPKFSFVRL